MAVANRTWGEERIADELFVKPDVRVSPRTVRRYIPTRSPRQGQRKDTQAWSPFAGNRARPVLSGDFFVVVTAAFRVLYVFVALEIGTRRILPWNVTEHPSAEWTAQQFRMIVSADQAHRFVIDRDTTNSERGRSNARGDGAGHSQDAVRVSTSEHTFERPDRHDPSGVFRVVILLTERHLRGILREWIGHYNRGRPQSSLGPALLKALRSTSTTASQSVIGRRRTIVPLRRRSSVGCIRNIDWRRRHEVRSSIFEEDRWHSQAGRRALLWQLRGRPVAVDSQSLDWATRKRCGRMRLAQLNPPVSPIRHVLSRLVAEAHALAGPQPA